MYVEHEYTELEDLQSTYSDYYKEVYGFRPRNFSDEQWNSVDYFKGALAELAERAKVVFAEEERREQENVAKFEKSVSDLCAAIGKDRETIVRWLFDGADCRDWDQYCWELGIPFGYFKEFV